MKKLINKFRKLDNVNKFGVVFMLVIFIPLIITIIVDILTNGSNLH